MLVESIKYGAINKNETAPNGFYVIIFTSESYTIHNNTTIDGQLTTAGELVVKSQYLCSMRLDTNWYWDKYPQQHAITVSTCTIPHPRLEVNEITYIHDIPKSVCNRKPEKNPYQDILYVLLILNMITS